MRTSDPQGDTFYAIPQEEFVALLIQLYHVLQEVPVRPKMGRILHGICDCLSN